MIRERILFRLFFSLLLLLSFSPFCTYEPTFQIHPNGILWIARSGARWEDLPARYGPHQTVYSCFCRWRDDGTLERIFHALGTNAELEELNIDSTNSKVSEQASRGPRKR